MKIIKLLLLFLTIIAICFAANNFIYQGDSNDRGGVVGLYPTDDADDEKYIRNQIDSLKNLPALIFENNLYGLILLEINRDIKNSEKNEEVQQMAYTV